MKSPMLAKADKILAKRKVLNSTRQLINALNALILKSKFLPSFSLSYSIPLEPELRCLEKGKIKHFNKSSAMRKCVQGQFLVS